MNSEPYPIERNLDGVYFRVMRNGKGFSICFTDLTAEEQDNILSGYEKDQLLRMCKILAEALRQMGDQLDIVCNDEQTTHNLIPRLTLTPRMQTCIRGYLFPLKSRKE